MTAPNVPHSVYDLDLPAEIRGALLRAALSLTQTVINADDGDLLKLRNIGRKELIAIRAACGQDTRHLEPRAHLHVVGETTIDEAQELLQHFASLKPKDRDLIRELAATLARTAHTTKPINT